MVAREFQVSVFNFSFLRVWEKPFSTMCEYEYAHLLWSVYFNVSPQETHVSERSSEMSAGVASGKSRKVHTRPSHVGKTQGTADHTGCSLAAKPINKNAFCLGEKVFKA